MVAVARAAIPFEEQSATDARRFLYMYGIQLLSAGLCSADLLVRCARG